MDDRIKQPIKWKLWLSVAGNKDKDLSVGKGVTVLKHRVRQRLLMSEILPVITHIYSK